MTSKKEQGKENLPATSSEKKEMLLTEEGKLKMLAMLGDMKNEIEITAEYFDPEVGEEVKCYFVGTGKMKSLEDENVMITSVKLLMPEGHYAVNANIVLVNSLMSLIDTEGENLSLPLPVKIIKTGSTKTSGKKEYYNWKVFLLS